MSKHTKNKRHLAILLLEAYEDLTVGKVERLLDEAQRVKRKQVRFGLMHAFTGRKLE